MAAAVGKDDAGMGADRPAFLKRIGNLFGDLTFSQVAAGALAAVTSMLLASSVGIAGSLIGAAVGSVVATVSSQVYRRFLNASAEKLHGVASGSAETAEDAGGPSSAADDSSLSASETVALPAVARVPVSNTPRLGDFSATASAAVIDARAQRVRKARLQRRVVACSAVSALIAVALTAAAIGWLTAGEGLGAKPVADGSSSGWTWVTGPSSDGASASASAGGDADGGSDAQSADGDAPASGGQGQTEGVGSGQQGEGDAAGQTDSDGAAGSQDGSGSGSDSGSASGGQDASDGSGAGSDAGSSGQGSPDAQGQTTGGSDAA